MDLLLFSNTDLINDDLLCLEAVFLIFLLARLLRLVFTDLPLNLVTDRLQSFLFNITTDLPLDRFTILVVDILLRLLGSGSNLKLTFLHLLSVTVLLLRGDGELICELLAVPGVAGLAELFVDLQTNINFISEGNFLFFKSQQEKTSLLFPITLALKILIIAFYFLIIWKGVNFPIKALSN